MIWVRESCVAPVQAKRMPGTGSELGAIVAGMNDRRIDTLDLPDFQLRMAFAHALSVATCTASM